MNRIFSVTNLIAMALGLGLMLGVSSAKETAVKEAKVNLNEIKHPVKPMLWKIEGKGLKQPSYLFGTVHISDPRVTTLHPLAQKAFDQAAALYTEVDFSPASQLKAVELYMRKDDKSLEGLIGKEMVAALNIELSAINPALNAQPFDKMNLCVLALTLPQIESQLKGAQPLDMQLWDRAGKAGKRQAALETFKGQIEKFDQLTFAEQLEIFDVTLKLMKLGREKKVNPYQQLIDSYLLGDIKGLESELNKTTFMGLTIKPETEKKFIKLLLHDRNKDMTATIFKTLADPEAGSCFFAAGAAHYVGKLSVNHYLKEAGYKVTLVTE